MATNDDTPIRNEARDGNHRFTRSIDTVKRDAQAAELRAQGLTYEEIAERLGYKTRTGAWDAVQRAVREIYAGPAQAVVELEVTHLERITDEVMQILQRDHVVVSHGKVVRDDDGTPLLDDGVKLQAIDRYVKARESLRRLLGVDKPAKVEHSGGVRYEVVGVDPADLS